MHAPAYFATRQADTTVKYLTHSRQTKFSAFAHILYYLISASAFRRLGRNPRFMTKLCISMLKAATFASSSTHR